MVSVRVKAVKTSPRKHRIVNMLTSIVKNIKTLDLGKMGSLVFSENKGAFILPSQITNFSR